MGLREVQADIEEKLNQLKIHFVPEMELTFIARLPGNVKATTVTSNDSLVEVIKAVEYINENNNPN